MHGLFSSLVQRRVYPETIKQCGNHGSLLQSADKNSRRNTHGDPGPICSWPKTCQQTTIRRDIIPFIHAKNKKRHAVLNKRHLPSITALQCFEAATRHLSFTRAAEELNLTQSRSEEHTSELQSQSNLVCRLLLEKKKK